jgi:hypothetical protein
LRLILNKTISGKWKDAYDCLLEQEILFTVHPHCLPADNPQQAKSSSCAGLGSNFNCRYDHMGGSKEYKETNEGYHAMFKVRFESIWAEILSYLS